MRQFTNAALAIILCACLIRIPVVIIIWQNAIRADNMRDSRFINNSDSHDYVTLSENITRYGHYTLDEAEPFTPNFNRAPGYPVFLNILYRLSGMETNPLLILIMQMCLSLMSVYLVMLIGRELYSNNVGLIAGAVYSLAPITIVLMAQALSETLFTTLLLGATYFFVKAKSYTAISTRLALVAVVVSAVLFGLAANVRAIALYVMPILLIAMLVRDGLKNRTLQFCLVMTLVFVACILPWTIRNYRLLGTPFFASVGDSNLLLYNAASVVSHQRDISLREAKDIVGDDFDARLNALLLQNPHLPEHEIYTLMRQVALEYLLEKPIQTVFYHMVDSAQVLRPGYSQMNLLLQDNPVAFGNNVNVNTLPAINELSLLQLVLFAYMTAYYGLLYLLVAGGVVWLLFQRRFTEFILMVLLPYWFAFVPSVAGNSRFRVPLEGFMALLAALTINLFLQWWRHHLMAAKSGVYPVAALE